MISIKLSKKSQPVKMGLIQQEFWKIKTKIAPKCFEMMHSLIDPAGNEITQPLNPKSTGGGGGGVFHPSVRFSADNF